jgi:hypothetical protein
MALTRPKYSQIYDSDFKNSARVATTTNVTLSGAAPLVVDGVTLVLGDRVLVRVQSSPAQNGIYRVNVLGTGSNGTWGRTSDADTAVKLSPGTTLTVEEGSTLAGKLYRMTSTNPITLGSTAITWTDVSGGGGSAGGNDGQIQYNDTNAFGGATYLWYNEATGKVTANAGIASTTTTSGTFIVTGGVGVSGAVYIGGLINVSGSATVGGTLAVTGDTTITGNLTVSGTTTNINTTNLVVEDKNIVIADVATPTDITADGAGITVKGATDKTLNWVDATDAWTSSEDFNLLTGKQYEINGTSVLTATTLGSGVTASSLTSLGTIGTLVATNSRTTTAVATNFSSGNIVATSSTSGTWGTANVSLYESVTASTTNATFYPILADKTAGNTGGFSAVTLTHNPSTGNLTATGFVGTHYGSAVGLTSIPSGQLTGTMATSVSSQLFNNMGQSHATRTSFDATTPSYDFGHRFVQGSTNGPGTGGSQFYSWYMGIGSDYPATGAGSYGAMFAVDRNSATPYLTVRYNENNAFGSWRKIQAGYADTAGTVTTAAQTSITSVGTLTGLTVSGAIVPNANLTVNIGSTGSWFNTFYGVATQAKYADLAENYQADAQYEPGTVLVFGGTSEVTTTDQDHNTAVAGIVSTNPAHLMNGMLTGNGVVALGLTGRLPCRVQGPINKGDVLVTSTTLGVAQRIDNSKFLPGCVVGKALESINTNTIQTIEVVVGRF